jgi:Ferritin-like
MGDSYFRRLQWVKPDYPSGAVTTPTDLNKWSIGRSAAQPRLATIMERTLWTIGLPIGSTPEARSSPLLEARDLLRAASEVEHGLLVQYLYAAYSSAKPAFRGVIAQIAREEMGHLISVQNLTLAIGGHPYFGRDQFPTKPSHEETFPFALTFEPLGLDSLAKYIAAESPPLENITDPALRARVQPIIDAGKVAAHQSINHVGALYLALYWLFKQDDSAPTGWPSFPTDMVRSVHNKLGRKNWHVPDVAFASQADLDDLQANTAIPGEDWNKGDIRIYVRAIPFLPSGIANRDAILTTLFDIAEQGEGWEFSGSTTDKSHFLRFLETYESIVALPAGSPAVAVDVPINPSTIAPAADGYIANPEANLWGQIFNVRYRIALLKLTLAIASRRTLDTGTVDGRAALISDAIETEMKSNLRSIALQLVRMRLNGAPTAGPESKRAAPPFELSPCSLPDLVDLDPDPKVAEGKAIKSLRRTLKNALEDTAELVQRVVALPTNLLDSPAPRELLTDIVTADANLLASLV